VTALCGQRSTDVQARQHRDRPQPADRRTGGYPRESQLELAGPATGDNPGRSAALVSADRLWRVDDVGYLP
jgi:hypothetical protein